MAENQTTNDNGVNKGKNDENQKRDSVGKGDRGEMRQNAGTDKKEFDEARTVKPGEEGTTRNPSREEDSKSQKETSQH